jgi:hypothetical protein
VNAEMARNLEKESLHCESNSFGDVKSKMDSLMGRLEDTRDGPDLATITVTVSCANFQTRVETFN